MAKIDDTVNFLKDIYNCASEGQKSRVIAVINTFFSQLLNASSVKDLRDSAYDDFRELLKALGYSKRDAYKEAGPLVDELLRFVTANDPKSRMRGKKKNQDNAFLERARSSRQASINNLKRDIGFFS